MVHRLVKLPLSLTNYKIEYDTIISIAVLNGYNQFMIDKMVERHAKKVQRSRMTSFFTQNASTNNNELKRVCLSFVPEITNKLKGVFKKYNMQIVFSSSRKIQHLLGSTKDKIDQLQKTGVYQITCSECDAKYYGQTRRTISERLNEHLRYIKSNQPKKSALANHALTNGHTNITTSNIKLLKEVIDPNKLDAYEAFYIQKDANALNLDEGNVCTELFSVLN